MQEKALSTSPLNATYQLAAISDRFTQLRKSGIIVGATIRVNHKIMNHGAICSVLISVNYKEINEVIIS